MDHEGQFQKFGGVKGGGDQQYLGLLPCALADSCTKKFLSFAPYPQKKTS